jgi:hypothetical protein
VSFTDSDSNLRTELVGWGMRNGCIEYFVKWGGCQHLAWLHPGGKMLTLDGPSLLSQQRQPSHFHLTNILDPRSHGWRLITHLEHLMLETMSPH